MTDPASLIVTKIERPFYTFSVPALLAKESGVTALTFVELTGHEERMAFERGGGNQIRTNFELIKEALRKVNGVPVNTADATCDKAWDGFHPKIRQLCATAYAELHSVKVDDTTAFLQAREITVAQG